MWVSVSTLCLLFALCGGREVTLPDLGTLDGTTTLSSWTNRTIYQYQGIPFAEPPTGSLRFKPPKPYTRTWTGKFDASDFGPVCPQDNSGPLSKATQHENCLHINIYTPTTGGGGVGTGMPVMVYIHGGSFRVGSARNILPNYLLEEDVVLAVPQYRLGPLGFLSLKTDEVPGNQGMLDVLMALEWVHKNIQYFGGDPNRVTLFGQSAGAAGVTFMLFSPLLKDGRVHRVIAQSGSALGTWAVDPDPLTHARMIAAHANCTQSDLGEMTSCLRDNTTVKELLDAHSQFLYLDIMGGGRAVGGNHIVWNEAGDQSFLPDDPQILLKEGKFKHLPLMGGVTKHEGTFFLGNIYDLYLVPSDQINSEDFLSRDMTRLTLEYSGIEDRTGYVANVIRDMYFTDEELGNFTRMTNGLVDICGVALLKASTFTMVNEVSRRVPSYLYTFSYFGRFSTYKNETERTAHYPFPGGIAHSDDLLYLFPQEFAVLNEEESSVAKKMVQFWTSFATTGVPKAEGSPDWPKVTTGKGPYMKIEKTPTVHDNFFNEFSIAVKEGLAAKPKPPKKCTCKKDKLSYTCLKRG